ncbi:hypothetical protein KUTeg_012675 [Tegillarca granosa]|uniref:Neurotransmitter-gated ion-channel transmembrane domain-containing protein n=1 Tax=Tegillarca granosa TaxID=220873 RepID=A0ABQ9F3R7_TEGGR|nr:hypothetical protein KUTeg_012675 [Tegillarca granosa]
MWMNYGPLIYPYTTCLLLILAITMMFLILENSVSFQHSTIPRLAIFYLVVLIMAAISITLSAFILAMLERGSKGRPLPAWLKKITFGRFGIRRLMCMENMTGDRTYSFLSMKQLEESQDIYSQPQGTEMTSTATTSDIYLGDISKATRIMAGKVITEDTCRRNSEEWVEFARVIDNVLFFVFVFVLVIVFASFGFK